MGTNTGQVMTLTNSIIGVSILAMPYCFKQCGIGLSVFLLCLSSILSRFACHFLLKAAIITRRRNYEFLAFHVFGATGKLGVELAIIGFLLGTCIAFFVVMGDLGPAIISSMLGLHQTDTLRTSILVGMALFVVLPLGLLRNVDSLSSLCTASFAFYICLVLKVMGEAAAPLVSGDWLNQVNFWRPEGIWQCLPIFSMALFCQTQLFEIFDTVPNVSLDKLNAVVRVAVNLCTTVYISVGFFGYVAFSKENISGNILVSLSETMSSEVIKVGFILSVAVSFPLVIFPCRASLYSLLYRSAQPPMHDIVASHVPEGRFKMLTIGIVGISLIVGLLLPNIERVLGIIGSTIGVAICIITPSLLLGNTARHSKDRLLCQVIMFLGAIIMMLGTYTHVLHSEPNSGIDPGSGKERSLILDHDVDRLNEQPLGALDFQHLSSDKVKKLIETTGERDKFGNSKDSKPSFDKSSVQKNSEIYPAPSKTRKLIAKPKSNAEGKDRAIQIDNKKLQEPSSPADAGEKQQEPPVPVEAVVKPVSSAPASAARPASSSERAVQMLKPAREKTDTQEQPVIEKSKVAPISRPEEVNQDAIRHEDAESALEAREEKEKSNIAEKPAKTPDEIKDQKKKDEEQKLIDTLKEHQEVQRDMLNEQQKILQELKKHEHVQPKVSNEVLKDPPAKPDSSLKFETEDKNSGPKSAVKQSSETLPKVPDNDLVGKDTPVLKKINISAVNSDQVQPPIAVQGVPAPAFYPQGSKFAKGGSGPVVPLPLAYSAKLSSTAPPAKVVLEQADSKPAARDILESDKHQSEREKRDVLVKNMETDQGAGSGPVSEEEQRLWENKKQTNKEDLDKQCTQNGKSNLPLKQEDSISGLPNLTKNIIVASDQDRKVPELPKLEIKNSIKQYLKSSDEKPEHSVLIELKTPSSISEPQLGIMASKQDDSPKNSVNGLFFPADSKLKSVLSKEGQ